MDLDFLRTVWQAQQPDDSLHRMYLGHLGRGNNDQRYYDDPVRFGHPIFPQNENYDLFFAPNLFTGQRKNENMAPSVWLYADLDEAEYPALTPTWYWETSPGNTQAMWKLNEPMDLEAHSRWNKALTTLTGADPGGWHASKLLRVPSSYNYKRGCPVSDAVHVSVSYSISDLHDVLTPYITALRAPKTEWEPRMPMLDKKGWEAMYWDRLSLLRF